VIDQQQVVAAQQGIAVDPRQIRAHRGGGLHTLT
jgi:hypothetical protein